MATGTINLQAGSPDLMTCGIDAGTVVGPREVFAIASAQYRMKRIVLPANYVSGLVCKLICQMVTATSGTVIANVALDAKTPGSDDLVDTADYGAENASAEVTVPDAVTKEFQVPITLTDIDSAEAGDDVRVRVTITAGGSATDKLNLLHAYLEYTTS
jgi:hypothetical protein